MKMISDRTLKALLANAEKLKQKNADGMLTKRIFMSVPICLELGLKIQKKEQEAWDAVMEPNTDVLANVRLSDYLKALEAYAHVQFSPTPSSGDTSTSSSGDDTKPVKSTGDDKETTSGQADA